MAATPPKVSSTTTRRASTPTKTSRRFSTSRQKPSPPELKGKKFEKFEN